MTSPRTTVLVVESSLEALDSIAAWIQAFLTPRADRAALNGKLNLAIEEIVANIVAHGYPLGAPGDIRLILSEDDDGVRAMVEDAAPAFDPIAEAPEVDVEATLEDRELGSLGLFMVRELADEADYERRDGLNRVLLFFRNSPDTPSPSGAEGDTDAVLSNVNLGFRFSVLFLTVFVAVMAFAGLLNFLKFERAYLETAERRYDATLREARGAIESSLGTGLTLAANFATQIVLDNIAAEQNAAVQLTVYGLDGAILFQAPAQGFVAAPFESLAVAQSAFIETDVIHTAQAGRQIAVGIVRKNNEAAGYIAAAHEGQAATHEMARLRATIIRATAFTVIVFAPFLAFCCWRAVAPVEKRHRQISDAVRGRAQGIGGEVGASEKIGDEYALTDRIGAVDALLRAKETSGTAL